ncbi:hypothetical protein DACRYDRAFT_23649 [Dacryopinax primogenitus]|uniref:Uncharacterized protein n=1 Tax=Dacryopinax primogenitus (strain DJM 731) TaxID=1858805 RepID=M5FR44_DACPD|nr:uncharacterized protein DACRYDRAFT_23649 [Dacryopinax primogenitus]EJT99530.1 hypothetical protein DACRYDRAFT_23649 [Dacryopinax primogenitus]
MHEVFVFKLMLALVESYREVRHLSTSSGDTYLTNPISISGPRTKVAYMSDWVRILFLPQRRSHSQVRITLSRRPWLTNLGRST